MPAHPLHQTTQFGGISGGSVAASITAMGISATEAIATYVKTLTGVIPKAKPSGLDILRDVLLLVSAEERG